MTITGGSALPKEDIERMMREAEEYADEDRKRREEVEVRNQTDSLVYSTEKQLVDNADKIPEDVKVEVQAAVDQAKTALEGDDAEAMRTASDHLAATAQKIGAAIYANTQPQADAANAAGGFGGKGGSDGSDGSDEDVVDAEIVDDEPGSDEPGTDGPRTDGSGADDASGSSSEQRSA